MSAEQQGSLAEHYLASIREAKSDAGLDDIGKDVGGAFRAKALTREELDQIVAAGKERRAVLQQAAKRRAGLREGSPARDLEFEISLAGDEKEVGLLRQRVVDGARDGSFTSQEVQELLAVATTRVTVLRKATYLTQPLTPEERGIVEVVKGANEVNDCHSAYLQACNGRLLSEAAEHQIQKAYQERLAQLGRSR